jgi:hypothetical protein
LTEDEGEPVSPPSDLEGNERTASRPTDSRAREVTPGAPDPVDRETAPPSRDGDETTRPEEAPLSREGKLRTPAVPELLPAGGRYVPRSTTRRSACPAPALPFRDSDREVPAPLSDRISRTGPEPAEAPDPDRRRDEPLALAGPAWAFDLMDSEPTRRPDEKPRLTDRRPSRDRACRARPATSALAPRFGLRSGWALRSEMLPKRFIPARSSTAPDSRRFWNWSRRTTDMPQPPFG